MLFLSNIEGGGFPLHFPIYGFDLRIEIGMYLSLVQNEKFNKIFTYRQIKKLHQKLCSKININDQQLKFLNFDNSRE